jgi:hypothetical protein
MARVALRVPYRNIISDLKGKQLTCFEGTIEGSEIKFTNSDDSIVDVVWDNGQKSILRSSYLHPLTT